MVDSLPMTPFQEKIHSLLALGLVVTMTSSSPSFADESKSFFSWNSNFIKKSTSDKSNKPKGIPAHPNKKKLKGIPTQPAAKQADLELTDAEKKAIQSMTASSDGQLKDSVNSTVKKPASVKVPNVPKLPQIPRLFVAPKNPNTRIVRIPSAPRAFSSSTSSSEKIAPDPTS